MVARTNTVTALRRGRFFVELTEGTAGSDTRATETQRHGVIVRTVRHRISRCPATKDTKDTKSRVDAGTSSLPHASSARALHADVKRCSVKLGALGDLLGRNVFVPPQTTDAITPTERRCGTSSPGRPTLCLCVSVARLTAYCLPPTAYCLPPTEVPSSCAGEILPVPYADAYPAPAAIRRF